MVILAVGAGLLATIIWLTTSPVHVAFGEYVKRTGDYDAALATAGVLPLVAAAVLWVAWPRQAAGTASRG